MKAEYERNKQFEKLTVDIRGHEGNDRQNAISLSQGLRNG